MTATEPEFDCPGLAMPQPEAAPFEGYVACYRAGHFCPSFQAYTRTDETHRVTSYRCPCCGERGSTVATPLEWDEFDVPENLRAGIVLDGGAA